MSAKPKLHEILAVEGDRESAAQAILNETMKVFSSKHNHFLGKHTVYKPFDEDQINDIEETTSEIVDTVSGKLEHCLSLLGRAIDVTATKDATNRFAEASVVVNGVAITENLPATTLLMLENRIKSWQTLFLQIPTLAPGRQWAPDPNRDQGVYLDGLNDNRFKTKKVIQHKIVVAPTPEHPAVVEAWSEDVRIGKTTDTSWSSMMSPADKALLLTRTGDLIAGIKAARQRANCQEVKQTTVANDLIKFVLGR